MFLFLPVPLGAQDIRVATYNTELSRKGPGVLLRDIVRGDPQVAAAVDVIAAARPDILLLQNVDFDHGGLAVVALADQLDRAGVALPHHFARRPNSGWQTGRDLDGDGRTGGARDAQGFGRYSGQGGMVLLSRFPVLHDEVRDFSSLLWADLPGAVGPELPDVLPPAQRDLQRLSTVAHWQVPIQTPQGVLTVLAFHAGPPVFDGPEDRNGYRNGDELRLWLALLAGQLGPPPKGALVLMGDANNDPDRGEGHKAPMRALLNHPKLQDPLAHSGPTVDWKQTGPMRVDYILPGHDLTVSDAGHGPLIPQASRHRLIWVDLHLP